MPVDLSRRDKVLEFVKRNGPLLPIQVSKEFRVDTMFSGAMLSELVNQGKVIVTKHLRVGGSPLYYVQGQEFKLENYTKYLNEKDRETIKILKEKGILVDKDCSALQRVSYRIVKDFAKNMILKDDAGEQEVFWRYYLVDEDAAKEKILDMVNNRKEKVIHEPKKIIPEHKKIKKIIEKEIKPIEKEIEKEIKPIEMPLKQESLTKPLESIEEDIKDFAKHFFKVNGINIWEEKVIKKKKEVNYVISFDSKVGILKYFVKFRDKGKINEGDISLAFNEAGNLPLLFLSKGDLTPSARKFIDEKFNGGIVFKKLK